MPGTRWHLVRRWAPEFALAILACAVFLGFLGSMELWGKREQRAAAETIDTLHEGHWLIAQIQGRPRLEKPPLPRWTVAGLMAVSGRQDEWMVRLPNALAGLGIVALTYLIGRHLGGRRLGLVSGLALASFPFAVTEFRQAGNDGLLAFFTTLALYAAWRRLHGAGQDDGIERLPADPAGPRGWNLVLYGALGLSFLTKGPIGILLLLLTVVPYLAVTGRVRPGLRALADPLGLLLFLVLALSWPLPVMLSDSHAVRVWLLEMGQKAGTAGIQHHRDREILALDWFGMTAPWCLIGLMAAVGFLARRRQVPVPLWFAWFWAMLNLLMFCFWTVAKPNYYLPCLPGAAILIGAGWLTLARVARAGSPALMAHARRVLLGHWVALFVAAAVLPVGVARLAPTFLGWAAVASLACLAGVIASVWYWRHGRDVAAFGAPVGAFAVLVLVAYGAIVPRENAARSHRELAGTLESILPPDVRTVMFFHELDEGLWFYLRGRTLTPVPGSNPQYNDGYDMLQQYEQRRLVFDPVLRSQQQKQILLDWMDQPGRPSPYVLIRSSRFDAFAPDLAGRVELLYRERDVKRNDLVLFRVLDSPALPGNGRASARHDDPAKRLR